MQTRRVYEILRYYYALEDADDMHAFEAELRRRLEHPYRRSKRDTSRLHTALKGEELAIVTANEQQQKRNVDECIKATLAAFDVVIERLKRYKPKQFV